jgi:hypothetical protein
VTGARLWVSYNDGATWSRVTLDSQGGGRFTGELSHPANTARKYVSLRLDATDSGGSSLNQTIIRAYGLQ